MTSKQIRARNDRELLQRAIAARKQSYSPYSRFRVGAAILTKSGKVFTGTNVENASYGLTVCAERIALFKAVSEGERNFVKIAVVGSNNDICTPCGACRQVLWELAPKIICILGSPSGKIQKTSLKKLLPKAFVLE